MLSIGRQPFEHFYAIITALQSNNAGSADQKLSLL